VEGEIGIVGRGERVLATHDVRAAEREVALVPRTSVMVMRSLPCLLV